MLSKPAPVIRHWVEEDELVGGYYVIDVPRLDTALEWAARCPSAASGAAEVRPHMPPPPA